MSLIARAFSILFLIAGVLVLGLVLMDLVSLLMYLNKNLPWHLKFGLAAVFLASGSLLHLILGLRNTGGDK